MKNTVFILLVTLSLFSSTHAEDKVPVASDMKFVTDFTGYACRPFTDNAEAPKEIADLGVQFTKLGISSNTRRVIIDIQTIDDECAYSADYSRQKGFKVLDFENSYITDTPRCQELKLRLDEIMAPGFKYAIKFNAYISLLFMKEGLTSECESTTKLRLVEFEWKL